MLEQHKSFSQTKSVILSQQGARLVYWDHRDGLATVPLPCVRHRCIHHRSKLKLLLISSNNSTPLVAAFQRLVLSLKRYRHTFSHPHSLLHFALRLFVSEKAISCAPVVLAKLLRHSNFGDRSMNSGNVTMVFRIDLFFCGSVQAQTAESLIHPLSTLIVNAEFS